MESFTKTDLLIPASVPCGLKFFNLLTADYTAYLGALMVCPSKEIIFN